MEQDSKATLSVGAISSGYSSESAHTLNQTLNKPNNEYYHVNPEEPQHRYSNIINSYEDESNESKGYSTYITDSQKQENHEHDEYQEKNDEASHHDYLENYETEKLSSPLINDERLVREVLAKAGPANTYMRSDYKNDIGSLGNQIHNDLNNLNLQSEESVEHYDEDGEATNPQFYNSSSSINQDPSPLRITKQNNQQNVIYKQQVNIRYLQPPTPPPPAPIIIREKQAPAPQRQPPIVIRQTAPAPATPPPLIIRERAPTPPEQTDPTVIERPIPAQPAPPRQVIIERVPAPPQKPRQIIYEKWLPYKTINRPVIVQKIKQDNPVEVPKNIIIEYEKQNAISVRTVVEEGIFRVDPKSYQSFLGNHNANSEVRYVERITDLPIEHSTILEKYQTESSNNASTKKKHIPAQEEKYDHFYNEYFSPETNSDEADVPNSSALNRKSKPYKKTNQFKNASNSVNQNIEYETISTSVPESLAKKIIEEAEAAGAINRTTKF